MKEFLLKLTAGTTRRLAAAVLLFSLFLLGSGIYSLKYLQTQYSMRQFMPLDHPLYASDTEVKKRFRLSEEQPILVTIEMLSESSDSWLDPERLEKLRTATAKVKAVSGIQRALSITNFETAVTQGNELKVGNIFSLLPQADWKKRVETDALLSPGFLSKNGKVTLIIGEIKFLPTEEADRILKAIRTDLSAIFPAEQYQIYVSGVVPLQTDMTLLVGKELQNFLGLAFLACFLTLIAYFRSFSSVVLCLILISISNIAALAWMALRGFSFSILSTSLPVLASITALAIGSHTLLSFGANCREHKSLPLEKKYSILFTTYRALFLPNLLMALTTVIGFVTLSTSKIPLIKEFGMSVAGGILLSWVLLAITIPAFLVFFPIPVARNWTAKKAQWIRPVLKFRFWILGFTAITVSMAAIHGLPLQWAVKMYDDLPTFGNIKKAADIIDSQSGGMFPLELMIDLPGSTDPWNDPSNLERMAKLLEKIRTLPEVGSAIGYSDFFQFTETKVQTRQSIAETVFLYSMSGMKDPLRNFLSSDAKASRVNVRLKDILSDDMQRTNLQIAALAQEVFPSATIKTGGMATMAHQLNTELSRNLISGLWESLLYITILLLIVFRSFRLALVAAFPNLLAPLALMAAMSLLKTPIKPIIGVIFSIALGVAYNNTVYLLARLRIDNNNVEKAWYEEGNPCLFSSLSILGGFAVFLSSYFSLNKTFGAYMLWSIFAGLIGDLIVFPILLNVFPWLLNKSQIFSALEAALRYGLRVVYPKRRRS